MCHVDMSLTTFRFICHVDMSCRTARLVTLVQRFIFTRSLLVENFGGYLVVAICHDSMICHGICHGGINSNLYSPPQGWIAKFEFLPSHSNTRLRPLVVVGCTCHVLFVTFAFALLAVVFFQRCCCCLLACRRTAFLTPCGIVQWHKEAIKPFLFVCYNLFVFACCLFFYFSFCFFFNVVAVTCRRTALEAVTRTAFPVGLRTTTWRRGSRLRRGRLRFRTCRGLAVATIHQEEVGCLFLLAAYFFTFVFPVAFFLTLLLLLAGVQHWKW